MVVRQTRLIRGGLLTTSLALVLVAGACGGSAAASETKLSITLYPNGVGKPGVVHRRLACNPASGTVPHPAAACRVLARLAHPFAPVAPGTICSALDTGPQVASVVGHVRGKVVRTQLNLRGSCEIGRWRLVAAVVPGFAAGAGAAGPVVSP